MTAVKKVISMILVLALAFSPRLYASDGGDYSIDEETDENAVYTSISGELPAKTALLMEQTTGTVLFDKNSHEELPMASITKIMTMLLVMEALEKNECSMDDMVTTSAYASSMGGSQIWLKENEQMTLHDLLKACAIGSANDAAMALAEHIAGSEEQFVEMMNSKANALGMKNTHFANPTGLDAENHYSSAYDIALMSRELMKHSTITEFSSVWMDSLREGKTQLVNTNKLVRFYDGCTGLKTGTTDGAGSCVSVTATRDGFSLIAVTMGCATSKERFESARKLLDDGFANYSLYYPSLDMTLPPIAVKSGVKEMVDIEPQGDKGGVVILKSQFEKITTETELTQELEAPVAKGEQVGTIIVKADDKVITKIPLLTKEEIEKMTIGKAFANIIGHLIRS